jgi:peptidoglycan/xylan/chitin deacetylase (PgdA/CDA1 family)
VSFHFRRVARRLAGSPAVAGLLSLLEWTIEPRPGRLRVLTYHRVDHPGARPHLHPPLLSATPDEFAAQMEWLARHWRVVNLAEVLAAQTNGECLSARSVLVTFDDAYEDFAEHAWPVLKRLGLPVALFVPTAYPGDRARAFWWDRLHQAIHDATARCLETPLGTLSLETRAERSAAARQLNAHVKALPHADAMRFVDQIVSTVGATAPASAVLDWDRLRALSREGVTLAPHTQTHPLMHRVSPAEAREEALGSLRDLRARIGDAPPVLAYPGGGLSDAIVEELRSAGFRLALTTESGVNEMARVDPLRLRRINVSAGAGPPLLRAQMLALAARA